MIQKILTLLTLPILGLGSATAQNGQPVTPADTLRREMVLEREFVPSASQAKKEFFNPLAQTTAMKALKPLSFARNTYGVNMSVRPKLFEPIYNSYARQPEKNIFHARLYGGYPLRFGANLGLHFDAGENGSLDFGIDHDSQKSAISGLSVPFSPNNEYHDTDFLVRYSRKLSNRTLGISASVYHSLQTFYALPKGVEDIPSLLEGNDPRYRLFQRLGGEIGFKLSPAPLLTTSPWQYALSVQAGYGTQEVPGMIGYVDPAVAGAGTAVDPLGVKGYDLKAAGSLAYGIKIYDFNFGADVTFETSGTFADGLPSDQGYQAQYGAPLVLSLDPFLSYTGETFRVKGGVKVQLLGGASRKFMVAPLLNLKWLAGEQVTLFIDADGGGDVTGFRELFAQNRYSAPLLGANPMNVAKYRISGGVEVGNIYGFSAGLKGGYALYADFYDWDSVLSAGVTEMSNLPASLFIAHQNRGVKDIFVEGYGRYVSPVGLSLNAGIAYHKYRATEPADGSEIRTYISGRPSLELNLGASYRYGAHWSFAADFSGLGGITQAVNHTVSPTSDVTPPFDLTVWHAMDYVGYESLPFVADLTARVSYDFGKYAGLSLIGTNLLNQKSSRWFGYDRPGAGIMAALTLHF